MYAPVHSPSQHRQLNGERGLFPPVSEKAASIATDGYGGDTGLIRGKEREGCARQGRAMTVAVRGYLGCAQLKSFVNL